MLAGAIAFVLLASFSKPGTSQPSVAASIAPIKTAIPARPAIIYSRLVYVAAESNVASDNNPGTQSLPYKTLSAALRHLKTGDDIVVQPGTYREFLAIPGASSLIHTFRIRAEVPRTAIIKGSDTVSDWRSDRLLKYSTNWPGDEPSQVFRQGKPLQQIAGTVFGGYPTKTSHPMQSLHQSSGGIWPGRISGSIKSMIPDSFWFDSQTKQLHIQLSSPLGTKEAIEVSVRRFLLDASNAESMTIDGLSFEHSNTSVHWHNGALLIGGTNNQVQNALIRKMDAACLQFTGGKGNRLLNSELTECGQLGLKAVGDGLIVEGNTISNNNTRNFNKWWEAGGMKFIGKGGLNNSVIHANLVYKNHGDGIWIDWGNQNNLISANSSSYNTGFGIHYEASTSGKIIDNVVIGNKQRGIYLSQSQDTMAAFNLVAFNKLEGIVVMDEGRRDSSGKLDLSTRRNSVFGNVIAWNDSAALILPKGELRNTSDANLIVQTRSRPDFGMDWLSNSNGGKNLSQWQEQTGQDLASSVVVMKPSEKLLALVAKETLELDPKELRELAVEPANVLKRTPQTIEAVAGHRQKPGPRE